MHRTRVWITVAVLLTAGHSRADLRIEGDRLTVATSNIRIVFQGGDIVEITNRITGERVAYGLQRRPPLSAMMGADGKTFPLRSDGWRRGHENAEGREAAQTVLRDLTRTVWLNVILDKDTDDVTIGTWGESRVEGVMGHCIAVRNLDLSIGRLIVPTATGLEYGRADARKELRLAYPAEWRAQMVVWQCPEGGIVIYSRDADSICKGLQAIRTGDYADVLLETRADGPWESQSSVPYVEWRINAYRGGWQVPASGYRSLMQALRPGTVPPESRLWASQIREVLEVPDGAGDRWLAEVVQAHTPARTLLFLKEWATSGPPDYRMTDAAATFLGKAHDRGFYVMVPVHVQQARQEWIGGKNLQRSRAKGVSDADSGGLAQMNPASVSWRRALIAALRDAFGGARPDAMYLVDAATVITEEDPDTGKRGTVGLTLLLKELQAAFPDMVLGADGVHEIVLPYIRISRRPAEIQGSSHPITQYLFGPSVLWFP